MDKSQIKGFIAAAARRAQEAGIDAIEVHGDRLLGSLCSRLMNFRHDEYGGSFENRYRFAAEVVKAIKESCGDDYPVSLRYSVESKMKGFCEGAMPGEDYVEVGRNMEESEKAAKYLQDMGYDMLNADNGTYDSWYWAHPPMYMPENCNLEDVAHIKKFVDIPVVCAGRMDAATASEAIAEGKIDGVGVARQFLVDPEWITKIIEDRIEDIKPCICCHSGCFNFSSSKGHANTQDLMDTMGLARCALNPKTMQSKKYKIEKAKKQKNIAVIGGGIGGMEAAIVLAQRGHKVTLYEKTDKLGGVFIAAAAPSFKEKDRDLIAWYRREVTRYPIEIKFNTEVKNIEALGADEVIIATGAVANKIPVPGADKAIEACEYLLGEKTVGENVVIVGGGLTGCEIAYDLFLQGKKPVIVEMLDDLITTPGVALANTSFLRDCFKTNKVPVYLETKTTEIRDNGVTVMDKNGKKTEIPCDNVILSVGYRPAPVAEKSKKVHVIGDACKVGNLRTVIWQAWDVAMKL